MQQNCGHEHCLSMKVSLLEMLISTTKVELHRICIYGVSLVIESKFDDSHTQFQMSHKTT